MSFLNVQNMSKSFGSTAVLRDISFTLERGKVLALIGSSGSGKTTLLRCLNFLERPDTGVITLNGEELMNIDSQKSTHGKKIQEAELREKRLHFGLVFQNFNLFPQYTALENVMLAPKLARLGTPQEIRANAEMLLPKVGLADKMNNYPHQLSGGQQQRTAIARALAMKPDILCFDEPTSALDPELTAEVLKVIRDLREEGHTMLIVTHEMDFVRAAADRVIFMSNGIIEEEGTPADVLDAPKSPKTRAFLAWKKEEKQHEATQ